MRLLKKIEEQRKRRLRKERNKKVAALTAGAALGTVAGILIAPKSGKETIQGVKEKSSQIKDKISTSLEDTKDKVQGSKLKIKEYLDSKKDCLKTNTVESSETNITDGADIESVNLEGNNTEA